MHDTTLLHANEMSALALTGTWQRIWPGEDGVPEIHGSCKDACEAQGLLETDDGLDTAPAQAAERYHAAAHYEQVSLFALPSLNLLLAPESSICIWGCKASYLLYSMQST